MSKFFTYSPANMGADSQFNTPSNKKRNSATSTSSKGTMDMVKDFWLFSIPHLPSAVTICALICGFNSVYWAMEGDVGKSIGYVFCAGLLDTLDGRLARYLNACSSFGAEIDSLADLVSFGVSPSLCVYIFTLKDYGKSGFLACSIYVSCMAIRLARFNVTTAAPQAPWAKLFFTGVPAPAGAFLLLLPYSVQLAGFTSSPNSNLMLVWLLGVAACLVSNIRTFSFKKTNMRRRAVMPLWFLAIALVCVLFSVLFMKGRWVLWCLILSGYLSTIPYSHYLYYGYKFWGKWEKSPFNVSKKQ